MGLFSKQQSAFDPAKDLPDLTGKVMIVTGGNGIGFATVQHLARRGAKIYLGARSEERAKAAIERLRAEDLSPGNGAVEWLPLDLSDPRKVKKSAEDFLAKEKRLDVLVHNAAVMTEDYKIDSDGVVESMMVNHFAPFVFTTTILPLLTQTAEKPDSDVRVVMVSSGAMKLLKGREVHYRNIEDINEKFGNKLLLQALYRYGNSKLAAALCANHLQRKLDSEGIPITIMSLHPGAVHTEGLMKDPSMKFPIIGPVLKFVLPKVFRTPSVGAHVSAFAAASPSVKTERDRYKGAFLWPPAKIGDPPVPQVESKELADEVWKTTETILKQWGI